MAGGRGEVWREDGQARRGSDRSVTREREGRREARTEGDLGVMDCEGRGGGG